jgi:hypothetical protein
MKKDSYYYSAEEWSRSIGYGELPPERLKKEEPLEKLKLKLKKEKTLQDILDNKKIIEEYKKNGTIPQ